MARPRVARSRRRGERPRRGRDRERVRGPARGAGALLGLLRRSRVRPRAAALPRCGMDPDAVRALRDVRHRPPALAVGVARVPRGSHRGAAPERRAEARPGAADRRGRRGSRPVERGARVALLNRWRRMVAVAGLAATAACFEVLAAAAVRAATLQTLDGALHSTFPGARIETRT